MLLPTLFLLAAAPQMHSPLLGNWLTPNHSVVQVHACGDRLCLRLISISREAPGTRDPKNPDATKRSRQLCGVEIGQGFHADGPDHARDGSLYDPLNGKTYSGELTANGSRLELRGYLGIPLFGRTETWERTTAPVPPCRPR